MNNKSARAAGLDAGTHTTMSLSNHLVMSGRQETSFSNRMLLQCSYVAGQRSPWFAWSELFGGLFRPLLTRVAEWRINKRDQDRGAVSGSGARNDGIAAVYQNTVMRMRVVVLIFILHTLLNLFEKTQQSIFPEVMPYDLYL